LGTSHLGTKLIKRQSATVLCRLAAFLVSDYCRRRGGRGAVAARQRRTGASLSCLHPSVASAAAGGTSYIYTPSLPCMVIHFPPVFPKILTRPSLSAGIHIFDINKQASSPFYLHSWVWKSLLIRTTTHALIKPFLELTEISC